LQAFRQGCTRIFFICTESMRLKTCLKNTQSRNEKTQCMNKDEIIASLLREQPSEKEAEVFDHAASISYDLYPLATEKFAGDLVSFQLGFELGYKARMLEEKNPGT
jgi:hypothetical protein